MGRNLTYAVVAEDDAFVARCLDVEVTSEGATEDEAIENLREALELYFEGRAEERADVPSRTYRFGKVVVSA